MLQPWTNRQRRRASCRTTHVSPMYPARHPPPPGDLCRHTQQRDDAHFRFGTASLTTHLSISPSVSRPRGKQHRTICRVIFVDRVQSALPPASPNAVWVPPPTAGRSARICAAKQASVPAGVAEPAPANRVNLECRTPHSRRSKRDWPAAAQSSRSRPPLENDPSSLP
jgi:hypothetical protein